MYAQAAIKPNTLLRNGAYGIVMRGVQKCTRGCSSLRGRKRLSLCCIKLDTATDPACGTSGFLVSVSDYLKDNRKQEVFFNKQNKDHYMNSMFHGYDMDRTMLRIGAMNMMTHGVYNRKPKKTELLFLTLFLRMLKIGGRCACIVPDGVLFGSSKAYKAIRKEIVEGNLLQAVISMPSGVFKPYAGVSTAILVFTKTGHGGTENVWFYDMKSDGFSLDDKRTPLPESDIPDIIERFHNLEGEKERGRTDQSFFVPRQEIVDKEETGDGSVSPFPQGNRRHRTVPCLLL